MIFIVFTTNPEAKYMHVTTNIQPQFLKLINILQDQLVV